MQCKQINKEFAVNITWFLVFFVGTFYGLLFIARDTYFNAERPDIFEAITAAFADGDNVLISVIAAIVINFLLSLYKKIILQRPSKNKFYRLPKAECKAVVVEKYLHDKYSIKDYLSDLISPSWIVFETTDGQQVKAYISAAGVNAKENPIFVTPSVSVEGTLYYRKGEKHNYFEDFVQD